MITVILTSANLVAIVLLGGMAYRLDRSIKRFQIKKQYTAALEAPSVSVCIPARNETHAMTQCLERVLASDYRKLEIIVFDDSSNDDTSVLIKSFAHAGVRFVPGPALPAGWLGKNHALEVLAREASGTYIVYLDVDTHIETTTISQLVGYAMTENLVMASVIPQRKDSWESSRLFGTLRYFWELVLSTAKKPATASSIWLIKRRVLLDTFGGFVSLKNQAEPESNIAAILGTTAYHCLISDEALGVAYEKRWSSQIETSRRLLYPMVGGKIINGLLASLVLILLISPVALLVAGLIYIQPEILFTALLVLSVSILIYGKYLSQIWRRGWVVGAFLWPVIALQELIVMLQSIVGYSRRTITWKGRPVSTPVNLPRITK